MKNNIGSKQIKRVPTWPGGDSTQQNQHGLDRRSCHGL
jgi:hypothetical protein